MYGDLHEELFIKGQMFQEDGQVCILSVIIFKKKRIDL